MHISVSFGTSAKILGGEKFQTLGLGGQLSSDLRDFGLPNVLVRVRMGTQKPELQVVQVEDLQPTQVYVTGPVTYPNLDLSKRGSYPNPNQGNAQCT